MHKEKSVFQIYNTLHELGKNLFTSEDYETCKDNTCRIIDILKAIEANKKAHQTLVKKFFDVLQEYDSDICGSLFQESAFLKANFQITIISTPELKDILYKAVDIFNDFINILNLLIAIKSCSENLLHVFLQSSDLSNLINILEKIKILPDLFDEYFKYIKYDA